MPNVSYHRGKEIQYLQQVQHLRRLSSSDHDSNPSPGFLEKTFEPIMTFFDLRSSNSSEKASTLEQRRHVRRPHPDNDDLRSLGSYTRPKPIPKNDKIVEELKNSMISRSTAAANFTPTRNRWLSTLRTPKPVDMTGHDESRRNSSAKVANPPDMVMSTQFSLNNASVTIPPSRCTYHHNLEANGYRGV